MPESRSVRMRSLRCTSVWPSLARRARWLVAAAVRSWTWTKAVAWAAPRAVWPRCVHAFPNCARWATAASICMVGGRR